MLRKLLKYDLRYLFKIWWIGAVTLIVMSLIGGFLLNNVIYADSENSFANVFLILFIIPLYLVLGAFSLYPLIISFSRFYKNFFSDEGYLTFTLPVKLTTHINSKLISSIILQISSLIVVLISILCIWLSASNDVSGDLNSLFNTLEAALKPSGIYSVFYAIEIIIALILSTVCSILFLFCCITFGSIVAKKAKLAASIGIYYGANMVIGFIFQIVPIMVMPGILVWLKSFPEGTTQASILVFGLAVILFLAICCGLIYLLQYYLLDRKLNLA